MLRLLLEFEVDRFQKCVDLVTGVCFGLECFASLEQFRDQTGDGGSAFFIGQDAGGSGNIPVGLVTGAER